MEYYEQLLSNAQSFKLGYLEFNRLNDKLKSIREWTKTPDPVKFRTVWYDETRRQIIKTRQMNKFDASLSPKTMANYTPTIKNDQGSRFQVNDLPR